MSVTIQRERFSSVLFAEILPLAQKCWNESTIAKADTCAFYGERDFCIEPDESTFQRLSDEGALVIVTLRDNGELKGYVVGFSYRALHHKKVIGGMGDSIYLEPDYRSYAGIVTEKFEKGLRDLGVQIIGWPVTPEGPIYEVLKATGYVGDDIVMEKRLCA